MMNQPIEHKYMNNVPFAYLPSIFYWPLLNQF